MADLGKLLLVGGLVITGVGLMLMAGFGKWFGQLPGDINSTRGNVSFHFPIMTCIVISLFLTLLLWLFRR